MSDTKRWPLDVAAFWYGVSVTCMAGLLSDSVTSFPDNAKFWEDVSADEIAPAGGYPAGGVTMSTFLTLVQNPTAGVVEFDVGTSTWVSNEVITVTGFRWVVLYETSAHSIIAVYDCGTAPTITTNNFTLTIPQSSVSPGVYPVMTMTRNLT